MARIKMPAARSTAKEITFEEAFHIFLTDSAARGLAEKTLKTYRTHLRDISHYFDVSTPLGKLSRHKMNEMVVAMRESGLATNSISSYDWTVRDNPFRYLGSRDMNSSDLLQPLYGKERAL